VDTACLNPIDLNALRDRIVAAGFAFVPAAQMRPLVLREDDAADWRRFAASWSDLPLDTHLPEGHRYRRRRHATLSAQPAACDFAIEPHRPHYQGLEYNSLVGGIERWFEPIRPEILMGASFREVMRFCLALFTPLRPQSSWHIECHQFRIEARREAVGQPTPEGVHRDGVDYVLVLLVNRTNIQSGTTSVHDLDGRLLGSFTLTASFDAALVDDSRVKHGVTAVQPLDQDAAAFRDVLVVTFKAKPAASGAGRGSSPRG
jgi:hypothetical protein